MGLFSAVGKCIARCINEAITDNRRKKAKQVAYKKVGKKLKKQLNNIDTLTARKLIKKNYVNKTEKFLFSIS